MQNLKYALLIVSLALPLAAVYIIVAGGYNYHDGYGYSKAWCAWHSYHCQ